MMYVDEYGCVDTAYVVHACMVDPCKEHAQEAPEYLIGLILHVGASGHTVSISYPNRGLRDAAFEELMRLVKTENAALAEDEEGEV